MAAVYDLILKGGTVVNQDGAIVRDIAIRDGRIAGLGDFSASQAGRIVDCTGLHVLPGVIDTQVHFREPGLDHKEDLEFGISGGGHGRRNRRLRNAEHQSDDDERGKPGGQDSACNEPHALRFRLLGGRNEG